MSETNLGCPKCGFICDVPGHFSVINTDARYSLSPKGTELAMQLKPGGVKDFTEHMNALSRVSQLEVEIAELKFEIEELKIENKFVYEAARTREYEARVQKLVEALEKIEKEKDDHGLGCLVPTRGSEIARQALAEYRGEIPESGEEE